MHDRVDAGNRCPRDVGVGGVALDDSGKAGWSIPRCHDQPDDTPALGRKVLDDVATEQPGRTGDEDAAHPEPDQGRQRRRRIGSVCRTVRPPPRPLA